MCALSCLQSMPSVRCLQVPLFFLVVNVLRMPWTFVETCSSVFNPMLSLLNVLCKPLLSSSLGAPHGGPFWASGCLAGPCPAPLFSAPAFYSLPFTLKLWFSCLIVVHVPKKKTKKTLTFSIWLPLIVLCWDGMEVFIIKVVIFLFWNSSFLFAFFPPSRKGGGRESLLLQASSWAL